MNIIALFLHILWDRKCKVTDSCFRSRDSDFFLLSNGPGFRSPQLTQKRAHGTLTRRRAHTRHRAPVWAHVHMADACKQTTHYMWITLRDSWTRFLSFGHSYTQSARELLSHSSVQDPVKCIADYLLNYKTNRKPCLLPTETIPNCWAYTISGKTLPQWLLQGPSVGKGKHTHLITPSNGTQFTFSRVKTVRWWLLNVNTPLPLLPLGK